MKAHLNAVWIPLQESSSVLRPSIRRTARALAASTFALALLFAPLAYAQDAQAPAAPKTETKVKIITIKDGKTEVVEALAVVSDGTYMDLTYGRGGHAGILAGRAAATGGSLSGSRPWPTRWPPGRGR